MVNTTYSAVGRSIRLFLVDGSPNGIITAEIMNWTGHVLYAPRSKLPELLRRLEAARTGVYLLVGRTTGDDDIPSVYVGEGDNVGVRIAAHSKDTAKDFWETACLVTSKDLNLTKAHVRYLESRLIRTISDEGRVQLTNGTSPDALDLPEGDVSDMEYFLGQLQVLLPVLGLDFVRPSPRPSEAVNRHQESDEDQVKINEPSSGYERAGSTQERPTRRGASSPMFVLNTNVPARAIEVDGQMMVLAGSKARAFDQPSLGSNVRSQRKRLIEGSKLISDGAGDLLTFVQDEPFSSPSAAAQAIMGTSRNGRTDWVVEGEGQTYADWQEAEIAKALASNPDIEPQES